MAENSKIEWCDHTMNFWIGCQEVSGACDSCYARVQNEHWKWVNGWGPDGERRRTSASNWHKLRLWNRKAGEQGVRHKVFSNSLSDFFDNHKDVSIARREAWHYIEQSPSLDFLILTKRPQNIAKMLPDPETGVKPWADGWPNVWLGTTTENQEEADRRIPHLLNAPAAKHFLSCEPLLGPVTVARSLLIAASEEPGPDANAKIDWVIAGGESGPNARPWHPDWARSLRDQCAAAGVPFFWKQNGEYAQEDGSRRAEPMALANDGTLYRSRDIAYPDGARYGEAIRANHDKAHLTMMYRVGKKAAGALLDGREWREFPRFAPLRREAE
jgi:protein gp37